MGGFITKIKLLKYIDVGETNGYPTDLVKKRYPLPDEFLQRHPEIANITETEQSQIFLTEKLCTEFPLFSFERLIYLSGDFGGNFLALYTYLKKYIKK